EILFSIAVAPAGQVKRLEIIIHSPLSTLVKEIPHPEKNVTYRLDLAGINLPAFSRLNYSYQAYDAGGKIHKSPDYTFLYGDNRFDWKTLDQNQFILHWYSGSNLLSEDLTSISQKGIQSALKHFPAQASPIFSLYLYDNSQALHQALKISGASQVIAHSLPEENILLLSVNATAPDIKIQLERQIPHEISHLIQRQVMAESYGNLPLWFSEGAAGLAELYPDAEDEKRVTDAAQKNALLSFKDLCLALPPDETQNSLAYAQSKQFVAFLEDSYGQPGMQNLVNVYHDGLDCEHGFKTALGLSLDQAEENWKRERLNIPSNAFFISNVLPYLITGMLLLASTLFSFWLWKK
ncbi:MAG: hypothetical protein LWX83_08885, partial [Anaerolineae bacterium]|nr:hypothetical protein [Anaerolineae bacterium]